HFRVVATNQLGATNGSDLTFTTPAVVPSVTTLAASTVTSNSATLNASVNPNGGATTVYFQYGLTTGYGSFSGTNSLGASNGLAAVAASISGLASATTYHFRVVASNSAGTTNGSDLTFTTAASVPIATTLPASTVTSNSATLNASVNPNGATTTVYFQYGLTTSYGSFSGTNSLGASNGLAAVAASISGLASATTYHFRVVASNSAG